MLTYIQIQRRKKKNSIINKEENTKRLNSDVTHPKPTTLHPKKKLPNEVQRERKRNNSLNTASRCSGFRVKD